MGARRAEALVSEPRRRFVARAANGSGKVSGAQTFPSSTKYRRTVRLIVSVSSGSAAWIRSRWRWQSSRCHGGSALR